jgi:signal transduction histidine kinase
VIDDPRADAPRADSSRAYSLRRTSTGLVLNIAGLLVCVVYFLSALIGSGRSSELRATPLVVVALAAWMLGLFVPARRVGVLRTVYLVMIVAGASAAWATNGLMIVPVIAALLLVVGGDPVPWVGYVYGILAAGLLAAGALLDAAVNGSEVTVEGFLPLVCGVLIAVLGGVNRRQVRAGDQARQEVAAQTVAAREEQAKAESLAVRQGLARDMHDVLAHSLGGLVIQLDAAEAQLEAGQTDAALIRLHDARAMAASGLAEARRAVEALRSEPDAAPAVAGADLAAALIDLVDAHERLGGEIDFEQLGDPLEVPGGVATAVRRALQEALSNARKHAPDQPVTVRITWSRDRVALDIVVPLLPVTASASASSPASAASATAPVVSSGSSVPLAASVVSASASVVSPASSVPLAVSPSAAAPASANPPTPASPAIAFRASSALLAASGAGRGLIGMRERFTQLGGSADWGVEGAAFAVHVHAPLAAAPAAATDSPVNGSSPASLVPVDSSSVDSSSAGSGSADSSSAVSRAAAPVSADPAIDHRHAVSPPADVPGGRHE